MERQPVGKHAARVDDRYRAVAQRLRIQLAARQPVGSKEQLRQRKAHGFLEIAALQLEVVLREVHPLLPHHPRERLHNRTC